MEKPELIESWEINDRINLYLLDAIAEENLSGSLLSKGRNIGEQFAHINNVRLMWLKEAMPGELEKCTKIEKDRAKDKAFIRACLESSGKSISALIVGAIGSGGRVKGFKPHVTAFVNYLNAHESHHRSQIIIAAKQSGHPLEKKVLFGIWEWGVR